MLLALPPPHTSRPAADSESRLVVLPSVRRPALQPLPSCPAARASRRPALRPARRPAPCPAAHRVVPCCPAQCAPHCPAHRTLLQPARRALLPYASLPAAARSSRSAAPRIAPCCSLRVAPYCPARHALLQPERRALLLCASRPAATSTSRPAAACASRSAAPRVVPYCNPHVMPCLPARRALLQPARHALLPAPPSPSRPAQPKPPCCYYCCCCCSCYCCCWWRCCWECWRCRRPAATTAAAAARATTAAGGGAAGSAGGAAGAGGAGGARGAAGSTGGAAGAGGAGPTTGIHCLSWPLSRQLQRPGVDSSDHCLSRTTPPLNSFRCISGSVEADALGSSESATAPGAGESAAALGAHESTDALGASASTATGPTSDEALHTFTLVLGASRCFFRDCTTVTPLAAPVLVLLADPTGGPVVAQASTVLLCSAVPSGSPLAAASPQHALPTPYLWPSQVPGLPPALACTAMPSRVEGRQRAAPHFSEFPPTTAPLQPLHMDVWGPAPVGGTDQERYFLLVVDDYTCYTTVFPLRRKADVGGVLIPWIRATRRQLRERFRWDLPILRPHSDRGGEFSSDLLAEFCQGEGIHESFTLPASPQKNGIAERRIGLIMELETSPTLWWTRKVGDALVFWVWGALTLVRDAKASKLSSRTLHCVFLGFPTDAPPWQFYHPRTSQVFSSQDVTFDEYVDPSPLVEPLEISSDSSGPAEGGDPPAADDTVATRRSPRLETPRGFFPQPSLPPPHPAGVDSEAETAGAEPGGA
ncbi:unnamed protein product [Closterium sp. NIES-54]